MIDNLESKLNGELPVTREELFKLVNSWGRKDLFTTEQSPKIRVSKCEPNECYNLSNLDVSQIDKIDCLFEFSKFNGDLSKWDLKSVKNLDWLFRESDFNNNSISNWDMSNKKSLLGMFSCSKFNGDLSNWDISNIENISYMFYYNKYFDNDSLKDWNTSNIYNMEALFKDSNFNGNISSWDVSNVKTMEHLFFKSPFDGDISSWNINENCKTRGIVCLCDSFNDKYFINSKDFFKSEDNFKIWFEKNRSRIKDINEPKEKVLDFFSFDNQNNLDKK